MTTETARRVMNVDGKELEIEKENLHRRARCYIHAWWRGLSALLSVEPAAIRRPLRFFAAVVFLITTGSYPCTGQRPIPCPSWICQS